MSTRRSSRRTDREHTDEALAAAHHRLAADAHMCSASATGCPSERASAAVQDDGEQQVVGGELNTLATSAVSTMSPRQ